MTNADVRRATAVAAKAEPSSCSGAVPQNQQQLIDSLSHKMSDIESADTKRDSTTSNAPTQAEPPLVSYDDSGFRLGRVAITGEGGVAFFKSQSNGQNPNGTFRVNEARMAVLGIADLGRYLFLQRSGFCEQGVHKSLVGCRRIVS